TFIAGFPGETQAEFEALERFIREVRFDRLGCFAYSPEEDTPAAQMENQIADDVKRRRCDIIMDAQYEITLQKNRARVGRTYEVLVDRYEEERGCYFGRSYMDAPEIDTGIYFSSETELEPGMFVQVLIEGCDAYDLTGKRVDL
ncbi:MAG: 30S ribosomal protein S12 methylthiotransferase RimO, partial [Clostridiales bacterium]|nr:30S ribosomal protein S12 methylthiotransferase RimO [Clostridiales bacterium]